MNMPENNEQRKEAITGIAIMGSNPRSVHLGPFDDPSWLIYACSPDNSPHGHSPHAKALPRVDQWFELHIPIAHESRPYGYLRWLENQTFPIWMRDEKALGMFPTAQAYPTIEYFGEVVTQPFKHPDGEVTSQVVAGFLQRLLFA